MIRLYVLQDIKVNEGIRLSAEELRYLKSVRRSSGEIEIFNARGQIATGDLKENSFIPREIGFSKQPAYDLHIAIALPEHSLLPDLVRAVSELGASQLLFFGSERSQSPQKRKFPLERLQKISLESARQCARGIPLKVESLSFDQILKFKDVEKKFWMDEAQISSKNDENLKVFSSVLVVVGSEGGWTTNERDRAKMSGFEFVHFETPILKVLTAATVASFYALQRMKTLPRHFSFTG